MTNYIIISLAILIIMIVYGFWYGKKETFRCIKTGCSGDICSDKPVITPCEWKCEHECYKNATCTKIDGKCQFIETPRFRNCIQLCNENKLASL